MHNFAVIWLQILTLILPKIIGMNMKEAPSEIYCCVPLVPLPFFHCQSSTIHCFIKQIFLPFVCAQIQLKITFLKVCMLIYFNC